MCAESRLIPAIRIACGGPAAARIRSATLKSLNEPIQVRLISHAVFPEGVVDIMRSRRAIAALDLQERGVAMKGFLPVLIGLLCRLPAAWAQLEAPNQAGVSFSHVHTIVRDLEATKK